MHKQFKHKIKRDKLFLTKTGAEKELAESQLAL